MRTLFAPVTVYTKPGCKPCETVKKLLEDAGIEYDAIDLTNGAHEDAYVYITKVLGAKSVPVTVDDFHEPIIGLDEEKLAELIAYHTASETGL